MRTAVAAPAPDPGWLLARLDRVPVGGFHRRLLLVSGLGEGTHGRTLEQIAPA